MLQPAGFHLRVERGWQPSVDPLVWGITGTVALLAVVAAAMATVLGVAELRPFLGTFAAVGADPGLSRRLAAAQAGVLGLVGSVLGVAIGLAVGAPLAIASTSHLGEITPVLALPWPLAIALLLVVPAVAAGVARISVPAHPVLVRRLA
jgi:putative ABC transport system permease protein